MIANELCLPRVFHATNWARRGYKVFPCGDPGEDGKRPRLKGWQDRATTDDLQIEEWWEEWPEANVGVALQEYEYVLDADGPDQVRWVQANLPRTLCVKTGRPDGGAHFYYDVPVDLRLRNRTVVANVPGLEGKTKGKLVVAPGSVHRSGDLYTVHDDVDPEILPRSIIDAVGLWEPKISSHAPTAYELEAWASAHHYASATCRQRGRVVYARAVRRLRRDLPVRDGWGDLFYVHARSVGEWVARGAYTYDELVKSFIDLFELLDHGDKKGYHHVVRSIHRGVAAGARSVV